MARKMKNISLISKLLNVSPSALAFWISKGKFKLPAHIKYIENLILEALRDGDKYLCINMPPRHGKSEYLSKYLPLWLLANYPKKRVILTSYETSFATEWGQKVKDIINEHSGLLGISISKDNRSSSYFRIDGHEGSMSCVGAGGAITGKGADVLIIDDPVKNDAEANSLHQRDMLFEWFKATAFTRIEPGGIMILLMTRWHEDDLCGRLKEIYNDDNNWKFVSIPAIAEDEDLIDRDRGEALWPARFNLKKLKEIEKTLGTYWFSALYQQSPTPSDGAVFNKTQFKYFKDIDKYFQIEERKVLKESCKFYATVDLAISTNEMADYSVVLIFAVSPCKSIFIFDLIREHFDPTQHIKLVEDVYNKFKPELIGIESVQYQISLVKELSNRGLPVKKLVPTKDKLSRALRIVAKIELGSVYFPHYSHWLSKFESELLEFPHGKHDDQVDCLSYVCDMLSTSSDILPHITKSISQSKKTKAGDQYF